MLYNSSAFGIVHLWINAAEFRFDEILEWNNYVQRVKSGKDSVLRIRKSPRKTFKYTNSAKNSGLKNSIFSNLSHGPLVHQWGIANWARLQRKTLLSGTTQLVANLTWPNEGLLLIWKSFEEFAIVEYYRVFENLIFLEPLDLDWVDSYVTPIEVGRLYNLNYRSTGTYGSFKFDLETDINDNFYEEETDYSAIEQLDGVDLFFGFQNYQSSEGWLDTYNKEVDIFDRQIGRISAYTDKSCTRNSRKVIFYQNDVEELAEFLKWIHRRAGRYRPFYAPTWNVDLELSQTGLIESELYVVNEGFGFCDTRLAVRTFTGNWLVRNILDISEQPGGILALTLNSFLGIDSSEVERISFLKQYAFVTDKIELRHFGNFTSECELEIEERFT